MTSAPTMDWTPGRGRRSPPPFHTEPNQVVRALIEARRLISSPGSWWRGSYQSDKGHLCLEAAIRDACEGDRFLCRDAMRVMREVLGIPHVYSYGTEIVGRGRQPKRILSLFDWNDAPGRTQQQVIDALDQGIVGADGIMRPREVVA